MCFGVWNLSRTCNRFRGTYVFLRKPQAKCTFLAAALSSINILLLEQGGLLSGCVETELWPPHPHASENTTRILGGLFGVASTEGCAALACSGLGRGRFYGRLLWAALACSVFEVPSGLLWLALGSGHLARKIALCCSGLLWA